ncbi:hypothetical protein HJG60_008562 [Phyllostomus discolor]|uniref:Uncharacterized protein n=1 Tax=Phyllostomus discolor TaxID=89673 RepID=A0A833YXW1_9CHIR|nr:hypothetical protein HJG60_008562 [Phyllostomus discolor]
MQLWSGHGLSSKTPSATRSHGTSSHRADSVSVPTEGILIEQVPGFFHSYGTDSKLLEMAFKAIVFLTGKDCTFANMIPWKSLETKVRQQEQGQAMSKVPEEVCICVTGSSQMATRVMLESKWKVAGLRTNTTSSAGQARGLTERTEMGSEKLNMRERELAHTRHSLSSTKKSGLALFHQAEASPLFKVTCMPLVPFQNPSVSNSAPAGSSRRDLIHRFQMDV